MGLLEAKDTSDSIFLETAGFVQHYTLLVVHWIELAMQMFKLDQVKNYYKSMRTIWRTVNEQPEEVSMVRYVYNVIENTFKVLIDINIDPL